MLTNSEKKSIYSFLNDSNPVNTYLDENNSEFTLLCFDKAFGVLQNIPKELPENKYRMLPFGRYQNTIVLNKNTLECNKYNQDLSKVYYSYCVNLDSNIISNIYRLFNGINLSDQEELIQFLIHLKSSNVSLSAAPYIFECKYNNKISDKLLVYKNLLYFYLFDRLEASDIENGDFINFEPNTEDFIFADRVWNEIQMNKNEDIFTRYLLVYCMLCKGYILRFSNEKKVTERVHELLEFMNEKLMCYMEFEFLLIYKHLKNDTQVSHFFRLFTEKRSTIINDIHNMSWDILHYRNALNEMAIRNSNDDIKRIYIHYFSTRDKGLSEVFSFNEIKRLVMYNEEAYPKYDFSFDGIKINDNVIEKFKNSTEIREQNCKKTDNNYYKKLAKKLENEIEKMHLMEI